jgi:hypothetical protein
MQINKRYDDGKAELARLIAAAHILKRQESSRDLDHVNDPHMERTIPEKFSDENALINSRNIFHEKLIEHETRQEAYLMLSEQYKSRGLESEAKAYVIRAEMETSTAKGFQAVIKTCEKKLEDFGIRQDAEKPRKLNHSLEAAERHLEEYKNSYAINSIYIQQVADNTTNVQQFEGAKNTRLLTPDEMKQFAAALYQRDSYITSAEQEALKAATAYKRFQSELNFAERFNERLGLQKQSGGLNHDPLESPSPAKTEKSNSLLPEREMAPINFQTNGNRFGLSKTEVFRQMVNDINREL